LNSPITIYTDGSCNTQTRVGAWAAIILYAESKTILQGTEPDTTHNRMELVAVIKAILFSVEKYPESTLNVFTDSQYVIKLETRKDKLQDNNFITKKGSVLPNADLLKQLIELAEKYPIVFNKVKAHQKVSETENLNREVDIICRKAMRSI
jgi:ribonuclease HI